MKTSQSGLPLLKSSIPVRNTARDYYKYTKGAWLKEIRNQSRGSKSSQKMGTRAVVGSMLAPRQNEQFFGAGCAPTTNRTCQFLTPIKTKFLQLNKAADWLERS